MCLTQRHNTVTLVRLEPAAPRSLVKHSTTELLRSRDDDGDDDILSPLKKQQQKNVFNIGPPQANLSGSAHENTR